MSAKTIHEAVKIGCKDLLADQETLIKELRDFFDTQVTIYEDRQGYGVHPPGVKGFFEHIFGGTPPNKDSKNE